MITWSLEISQHVPCYSTTTVQRTEVYRANFPKPPPELIKGEEVYEVENILKHQKRGQTYQYYVKWKGYPISEASWEPEEVFSDDGELLTQYKQCYQL